MKKEDMKNNDKLNNSKEIDNVINEKNEKNESKNIKEKSMKLETRYSRKNRNLLYFILINIILLIFFLGSIILTGKDPYLMDVSPSRINSLSKESIDIIKDLDDEIEIYITDNLKKSSVSKIAQKMSKLNSKIIITYTEDIDDIEDEDQDKKNDNQIIYIFNNSHKDSVTLSLFDLNREGVLIDDKNSKQYSLIEEKLINSIITVTNAEKEKESRIGFITDNEEMDLGNELLSLYTELRIMGFLPVALDLDKENIPENIETIAIIGPKDDLSKKVYDKLMKFQANGGNFILAATYSENDKHPRLNKLLASYGVEIPVGTILDYSDGNRFVFELINEETVNYNNILLPNVSGEIEITEDMNTENSTPFFLSPSIIKIDSEKDLEKKKIEITRHVVTSDNAVFKTGKTNDEDIIDDNPPEGVKTDTFALGVISNKTLENDKKSTAIIYSNFYFMTDLRIKDFIEEEFIMMYDNLRLAKNTFLYLHPMKDKLLKIRKAYTTSFYSNHRNISIDKVFSYTIYAIGVLSVITYGGYRLFKRGSFIKYGFKYDASGKDKTIDSKENKQKE